MRGVSPAPGHGEAAARALEELIEEGGGAKDLTMPTPGIRPDFFDRQEFPTQKVLYTLIGALTAVVIPFVVWPGLKSLAFSSIYLPHLYCYLDKPGLVWTHVTADSVIGISYVAISVTLAYLIHKGKSEIPFEWMFLAFGLFIVACASTHFMEVVTIWIPVYVFSAGIKVFTALVSLLTAVMLPFTVPRIIATVREANASAERQHMLEGALRERNLAQENLEEINQGLERRVRARPAALDSINHKLQAELRTRERSEEKLG